MSNNLQSLLDKLQKQDFATAHGTRVHARLQNTSSDVCNANDELIHHIISDPTLKRLFDSCSKCEVPIAGYINGKFVSRRIDRMRIDPTNKTIEILDYKTDSDRTTHRAHYISQLNDYRQLVSEIYPDFHISCFVLWTHDWFLEQI